MGVACTQTKVIMLDESDNGNKYPDSVIEENLLHEIMHHVSNQAVGKPTLFDDENMHLAVTNLLYQVLKDNNIDLRRRRDKIRSRKPKGFYGNLRDYRRKKKTTKTVSVASKKPGRNKDILSNGC
jgi:hypothetical protein